MKFLIKEARERAGLTQAELAEQLVINAVTLSGYETGKHDPKSETLTNIARICGVSVDYLLGIEAVDAPSPEAVEFYNMYDRLDTHGKQMVDTVMRLEYERCHPNDEYVEEYIRSIIQEKLRSSQGNQQSG